MAQTMTQTEQSQVKTAKGGGCCGGHKASADVEVQPVSQPSVQVPVAKSGGCCCSTKN